MKVQRLAILLTVINFALLMFAIGQFRPAAAQGVAPVLRGRALEIVDDRGRVRASIVVHPADPTVRTPDGKTYPDTVVLRLIDPNGRPAVKIAASAQGSGLALMGDAEGTYIQLGATDTCSSLRLTTRDGRQQLVQP